VHAPTTPGMGYEAEWGSTVPPVSAVEPARVVIA
jgi:hypothetical protein